MVKSMKPEHSSGAKSFAGWRCKRAGWLCGAACLVVLALLAGAGLHLACAQQASDSLPAIDPPKTAAKSPPSQAQQANQPGPQQGDQDQQPASFSLPAIDPPKTSAKPAATERQQEQQEASADEPSPAAADPNQPQTARECANLLKMATDLKAAVDRTTQDTLSVTVVRKANQIEEFARKVRLGSGKS
jgi:hypothetical protein